MCNQDCGCENMNRQQKIIFSSTCKPRVNPATLEDDNKAAFDLGFKEGFRQAREVFWEEFQIKASDAKMVAKYLNDNDSNSIEADGLKIVAATYLHAADVIIRDRRDLPGYIEKTEEYKFD